MMTRRMRNTTMKKRWRGVVGLRGKIFTTKMRRKVKMTCSLLESNWAHTNSVSSSSSGDWRELACPALSL